MNKHLKRALIGVIIAVLTMTMCLAGCGNTDELKAQIDDLNNKVTTAQETADKAVADLAAAKTELSNGTETSVNEAKTALEAAIQAVKDAYAAKTELAAAIEGIEETAATKEALDAAKKAYADADKALEEKLNDGLDEIKDAVAELKTTVEGLNVAEIDEAVKALEDALNGYEAATDKVVETLVEWEELLEAWDSTSASYTSETFAIVEATIDEAYFRIIRATSVAQLEEIIDSIETAIDEAPDKATEVYNILVTEIGEVAGVEPTAEHKALLDEANAIVGAIIGGTDSNMIVKLRTYGDNPATTTVNEGKDLEKLCADMIAKWKQLFAIEGAEAVKAAMDAVIAKPITLALVVEVEGDATATPATTGVDGLFDEWKTLLVDYGYTYADEVKKVEGFEDTIKSYDAVKARLAVLKAAKDAAGPRLDDFEKPEDYVAVVGTINSDIYALEIVGSVATRDALVALQTRIDNWCAKYDATKNPDGFDIPKPDAEGYIEANYLLVDQAALDAKKAEFQTLIDQYVETSKAFIAKVNAIPDADKLYVACDTLIADAFDAYAVWTSLNKLEEVELLLPEDAEKPSEYYAILVNKQTAYNNMIDDIKYIETMIEGELTTDLGKDPVMPYFTSDTARDDYAAKITAVADKLAQFITDGVVRNDTVKPALVAQFNEYALLAAKYDAYNAIKAIYEAEVAATTDTALQAKYKVAFDAQVEDIDDVTSTGKYEVGTPDKEITRLVEIFGDQLAIVKANHQ